MRIIVPPEVDMLLVSKNSRTQRRTILNFAPKIGLKTVDYARNEEIDNFYINCQNLRDFYRDPYNKLPRPENFICHYGKCGKQTVDLNSQILMQPVNWVREKQPMICPLRYEHRVNLDSPPYIGGVFDTQSCIRYKR